MLNIRFKRFDKSLPALYKDDERNAGFDLFARLDEAITLQPGEVVRIPLNAATEIPFNCVGLLFHRSSTYKKWKVKLTNNVGVIDSSYCGDGDEWLAEFRNESNEPTTVNPGDKVCQAIFFQLPSVFLEEVDSLGNEVNRGGFGTSFDSASSISKEDIEKVRKDVAEKAKEDARLIKMSNISESVEVIKEREPVTLWFMDEVVLKNNVYIFPENMKPIDKVVSVKIGNSALIKVPVIDNKIAVPTDSPVIFIAYQYEVEDAYRYVYKV